MTTICDKINTVGTTLQENLNDRGVSCTFGSGTGQTLLDLANLINTNNVLGKGDAVITITASRPYLLTGETTDLIVTLKNGVGQPLANKTIEITDGTSVYNGITNEIGVYALYGVSISSDTTFTATYESTTAEYLVEYCSFVDYAVTNRKSTDWNNYSNRLSVATDMNGTTLTKGSSNGYYYANNGSEMYENYVAEFDVVSVTNQTFWYMQGQSSSSLNVINLVNHFANGGHCKIVCDDGIAKVYRNGTQVGTDLTVTTTAPCKVGFRINAIDTESRSIKFKNFRVRAL